MAINLSALRPRSWPQIREAVAALFNGTSGHSHSGTDGEGPVVAGLGDISDLDTTAQDSLVAAINEVKETADAAYVLPETGIPETDLAEAVSTSLGKADTAYQLPETGIPATDMAAAVGTSLGKADTAYQKPADGIPAADAAAAVQTSLGKADTAYQKPVDGIPAGDLTAAAQTALARVAANQAAAVAAGELDDKVKLSDFNTLLSALKTAGLMTADA